MLLYFTRRTAIERARFAVRGWLNDGRAIEVTRARRIAGAHIAVVVVAATLSASCVPQQSNSAPVPTTVQAATTVKTTSGEPVRVALNTEMTGGGAPSGELTKKAADIAVEDINHDGGVGGRPMELIVEDAQSTNQGALAAVNKAAEDRAVAMVGPIKSTQTLAIEPRIRELEIPSLIGGTNPTLTHKGNPWLFRMRPADSLGAPAISRLALGDLQVNKLAVLHDSDAFGTAGADLVEQTAKDAGKPLIRRESYKTGDKDFTAQLLSIRQAGADGLVLYSVNPEDAVLLLRQVHEQALDVKLLGSQLYTSQAVPDAAGSLMDGLYVAVDYFPGRTPENKAYQAAWQARYGTTVDLVNAWTWDALHLIRDVYPKAGADRQRFREELLKLKDYKGAMGTISFNADGDGLHSVDVAQYRGTELQFIRTVNE